MGHKVSNLKSAITATFVVAVAADPEPVCKNTRPGTHAQKRRQLHTDYCICKRVVAQTDTHTCDEDHMVCAAGRHSVRKRGIEV